MRAPSKLDPGHRGSRRAARRRAAQVLDPRVDPGLAASARRAPGRRARRRGEVEQELQQDQPAGARAHLARPRGDERARQPVGEELLERRRCAGRRRSTPTSSAAPTARGGARRSSSAASAAARRRAPARAAGCRVCCAQSRTNRASTPRSSTDAGGCGRPISSLRPPACASSARVAATRLPATPLPRAVRDPAHRVGQVAVEAGEEAEAVLGRAGRRGRPCPSPGTGIERALPPKARAPRTRSREPALDELVRGAEPADAAAEDRHGRHARPYRPVGDMMSAGWESRPRRGSTRSRRCATR